MHRIVSGTSRLIELTHAPVGAGGRVFHGPLHDGGRWVDAWMNLSTGEVRPLGYVAGSEPFYVSDRSEAWLPFSSESRDRYGVLHVRRDGDGVATHFIHDTAVSVSPDGTRVVMPDDPSSWQTELWIGRVSDDGFAREAGLGIERLEHHVFGWFDNQTLLVRDDAMDLVRVTPGAAPVRLRHIGGVSEGDASHDMRLFVWVVALEDDRHVELHIASLEDATPERVIPLGMGPDGICVFAPTGTTIVCRAGDSYTGDCRVLAVDVATGAITTLSELAGPSIAFSPDGEHVVILEEGMTIVSLRDPRQRIRLGQYGAPFVWLR